MATTYNNVLVQYQGQWKGVRAGASDVIDLSGASGIEFKARQFTGPLTGNVTGNADTATAWASNATIAFAAGDLNAIGATNLNAGSTLSFSLALSTTLDGSAGKIPGGYGSASSVATFIVDSKGRLTAAGSVAISIPTSAVTNGGANTLDNLLAAKAPLANPTFTGTVTAADLVVTGTATFQGDVFSKGAINVITQDLFFDLAQGASTLGTQPGGITVVNEVVVAGQAIASFTAADTTVGSEADAYITLSATASGLALNDIVQVSGDAKNDGLYVVHSVVSTVVSTVVTLRSIGVTAVPAYLPFVQNNLVTGSATAGAKLSKVYVSVIALADGTNLAGTGGAIPKGEPCTAKGSVLGAFTTGYVSLQPSVAGQTIVDAKAAAGSAIAAGDILFFDSADAGYAKKANATAKYDVRLIANAALAAASTGTVAAISVYGTPISVLFADAGAPADGAVAYLSKTDGKATTDRATLEASLAAGDALVELGIVKKGTGAVGSAVVFFAPRIIVTY
jgi:hypothetical protein